MARLLRGHVRCAVAASTRPQSAELARSSLDGVRVLLQPVKTSQEYGRFVQEIRDARPDMLLCFSYSMMLPEDLLRLAPLGAANIHGGLLPQHRGANVLNWALIQGEVATGVTAHYMTARIDEGDIIFQERVSIEPSDTAVTLKARLDAAGFSVLRRMHEVLLRGDSLPRTRQDESAARYYKRRRPEDGRIDWTKSDREIHDLIRALVRPWPGAYYVDATGRKVVVDRYLTMEEIRRLRDKHGR